MPLKAYEINGSNYVKLRDIGQAVGFGISYDAGTNTVTIHPDEPYEMDICKPIEKKCRPNEAVYTISAPVTHQRKSRSSRTQV